MALFGINAHEIRRVERHLEKIERQLERMVDKQDEHAKRANGHPAKVIWHGMTWPQLIGLGMLAVVLILVLGDEFEPGWIGRLIGLSEATQAIAPALLGL